MSWTVWRGIKLTAALLLAGIVQAAIAGHVQLWGAAPDVLLTVSIVCAMFCAEGSSAAVGFAAGFIHASLAAPPGAGFGSLVVSRTLVCFGVGCLEDRLYRDSALVAAIVVAAGTAAAEGLFFVFNPSRSVLAWAPRSLVTVCWNALIAAPCYLGVSALLGRHKKSDTRA